ncbi:hypothetical protein H4217_006869 [Coemansia sp. RSA 1939]|nr:hypothetical protein H4217_006869 [Coemansia sp. RSA 1939]
MTKRKRTLKNADPPDDNNSEETLTATAATTTVQPPKKQGRSRTGGNYMKYTLEQIEKLVELTIEEGKTVKEAALTTGINIRTAQNYMKTYRNDDQKTSLPGVEQKPRKGRPGKLTEEHSAFLSQFIIQHPAAKLADIQKSLFEEYDGVTISVSALHRHLVKKCGLTLKKHEKRPAEQNTDCAIPPMEEIIEQWHKTEDLDFSSSCIFIDRLV